MEHLLLITNNSLCCKTYSFCCAFTAMSYVVCVAPALEEYVSKADRRNGYVVHVYPNLNSNSNNKSSSCVKVCEKHIY